MENVITLEKPNLLLVLLEIEIEIAAITSIAFADDSLTLVMLELLLFKPVFSSVQMLGRQQNRLSVRLASNFVLKCLFEFIELHIVSLIF